MFSELIAGSPNFVRLLVLMQKCAKALSLLPKAHGDAGTWSALLRRILIAINAELDFAFLGMEDGVFNFLYGCLHSASSIVPRLGSIILHSRIFLETIIWSSVCFLFVQEDLLYSSLNKKYHSIPALWDREASWWQLHRHFVLQLGQQRMQW